MRLHSRNDSLIGALVITGLVAGWYGLMWLKHADLTIAKRTVPVVIKDSMYLKSRTEVQVSGYTVGRLGSIGRTEDGRVRTTVKLTTDLPLHADATLQIHPSSALGEVGELTLYPGSDSAPMLGVDEAIGSVVEPPSREVLLLDSLVALVPHR